MGDEDCFRKDDSTKIKIVSQDVRITGFQDLAYPNICSDTDSLGHYYPAS
jgi:hypothetical protein